MCSMEGVYRCSMEGVYRCVVWRVCSMEGLYRCVVMYGRCMYAGVHCSSIHITWRV